MKNFRWTDAEVRRALGLAPAGDAATGLSFGRVWTDTRTVQPGDLFVALRGERFDAHAFLAQAAAAGATAALVSRVPDDAPARLTYYRVENTLTALGRLASHRRRALTARVAGVAGSNGKTTTKELIRAALGVRYRVHATEGNLNNQVGVPLTLLAAPQDAEVVVVEMGTNEPGEIALLTAIVEPDAGLVTSIGEEHLEKLGDLAGVLREESELLARLGPEAVGLVAEEPAALAERARALLPPERLRVAGLSAQADLRPDGGAEGIEVLPDGSTRWAWRGVPVHLPLPGRFNVRNALLALGLAEIWGVPAAEAVAGVGRVTLPALRGEWRRIGGIRVLADCYNSNPPSLAAAVDLLATLPADGHKVAVVGTMRELGTAAAELHRRAAEAIADRLGDGIDQVVATGAFAAAFAPLVSGREERITLHEDPLAAYAAASGSWKGTEIILLKASRGEALERWLTLLEKDFG